MEAAENSGPHTALHRAALDNHFAIASMLLDRGANIEATGRDGGTALHLAARNIHFATASMLLDKGGRC